MIDFDIEKIDDIENNEIQDNRIENTELKDDRIENLSFEELTAGALKVVGGLPLIPMRGLCVYPGMVVHFDISREKSILALQTAMALEQLVFLTDQVDAMTEDPVQRDLYPVGCIAHIKQMLKLPDNSVRVLIEVRQRAVIKAFLMEDPFFAVLYETIQSIFYETKENEALIRLLRTSFTQYMSLTRRHQGNFLETLEKIDDPDQLINLICAHLDLEGIDGQRVLAETDMNTRLMITYELLSKELEMAQIEQKIGQKVKSEIDKDQKEYYLREQIKVIRNELGDEGAEKRSDVYRERLAKLDVSDEVRAKVETEINRLAVVPDGSSEAGVIETYIEWILDLPWNMTTEEEISVARVRKVLNKDHYGLEKVKERILEYIAVLQLAGTMKSPILCLVGPPGVGKTSIARSIASALNRKYIRMSLGGIRDEAEIRGHRRTYIGAIPGRIIYHLKQAGSSNPLFLLDEIDKLGQDVHGDPGSALLEVLDPEQNQSFTDNYLELPFDLSKVLFLTTANSLSTIPRPLLDRMEVIEVNGYVSDEKYEIGKRYLLPKQLEAHGLQKDQIKITPKALQDIIGYYTRESGVRELERQIAGVCRVAAKEIVENEIEQVSVTPKNLVDYLGKHKYSFEKVNNDKAVGLVNGLAWTAVGGDTLEIEVAVLPGKGKVQITGQLGDVMQESAKTAISYTRSQAEMLGLQDDFYQTCDIHLHVPEGAVPKDGPSAGITMTTAIISALTGRPVSRRLAMTGEITLRGRVLPIGGLREKLTAAHRAGIRQIILPKDNLKDLDEIPKTVLNALEIHPVETMSEVLSLVFEDEK